MFLFLTLNIQDVVSESESERSENDLSKPQDYIKEIQIKTNIETENVQEELKEEILEDPTLSKWTIFDQDITTSRETLDVTKQNLLVFSVHN